jgi:hypothetical protein
MVAATLRELMEANIPVEINGVVQYYPSIILNETNKGVMIAKSLLLNNRQGILMNITRSLLEHKYTGQSLTHLFGPMQDPKAPPFLLEHFTPLHSPDVEPTKRRASTAHASHRTVMEHNVIQTNTARRMMQETMKGNKSTRFLRAPENEMYDNYLQDMAITRAIGLNYKMLPEPILLVMEEGMLQKNNDLWIKSFKEQVSGRIENGVGLHEAFRLSRMDRKDGGMGLQPPPMLTYPPISSNLTNDKIVTARTNTEWARLWEWADCIEELETIEKREASDQTLSEDNNSFTSPVDYVSMDFESIQAMARQGILMA